MLSSGMITHPCFIFPENFTHSFATAPLWISLCMRKIFFSFLSVYRDFWYFRWSKQKILDSAVNTVSNWVFDLTGARWKWSIGVGVIFTQWTFFQLSTLKYINAFENSHQRLLLQGWKIRNFASGFENILRPTFYAIRSELLPALKCLQPNKYQNSGIHLIRTKKNTKGRIIQCRPKQKHGYNAILLQFPLLYTILRHIYTRTILVYDSRRKGIIFMHVPECLSVVRMSPPPPQ